MKFCFSLFRNNGLAQLFSSRLFVQVTTILQSIIISRLLGPEGKGVFTEVILWPSLIASLSMLGLYTGIVRISAKPNLYNNFNITKSVLYTTLLTGSIGTIITFYVNSLHFEGSKVLAIAQFYAIYVLVYNINRGLSAINNGRGDLGIYSISSSILNPVYFICLLILFLVDNITLNTALISLLFANCCSCLFLIYKREKQYIKKKIITPLKMIKYSIKYSPSDFSEPLYLYYDKAIIAYVLSSYDLGIYTIAFSSAGLINIVSSTFSVKLFSDIARNRNENLFYYMRLNITVMLFLAIMMCMALPILIPLFFGTAFVPAILPSLLLLPVCILQGQSMIIEKAILAKGYPYVGIKAKCISMLLFAILSFILYLKGLSSLHMLILLLILVQLVYLKYLRNKMKSIFKNDRIIPNKEEVKFLYTRICSFYCRIFKY